MTCLHGFLGRPSDWSDIPCTAKAKKPDWMPILAAIPTGPALVNLAAQLNSARDDEGTLVGYSMGGRIALHMLVGDATRKWNRAIIVSASPGLRDGDDRAARMSNDLRWAERFQQEPWEETVTAWNSQAVFSNDPGEPIMRMEKDFNREHLAKALVLGSVAAQSDMRTQLVRLELPVLWLAGERDVKYAALGNEGTAINPNFQTKLIRGAGHRVPWTHSAEFCDAICEFLIEQ